MIDFSKIECTGCTACASICSKKVIVMEKDDAGFPTPAVNSLKNCIECGACEKVCPYLNPKAESINTDELAIIAQINDESIRRESASGGMFSAIALAILEKNGIVYGAAYNELFDVQHIGVELPEQLWKLRNSKYVQSDLKNVFQDVKNFLENGRWLCFSGTPCQVEGLASYLGRPYDKLILIDITCHGVGSPLIWQKYLNSVTKYMPSENAPYRFYFRWKHYGYKYSTMSIFDKDSKEVYFGGVEDDCMLRAYFTNSCDRNSCYNCKFKKRYRISDFTLWDCFQPRFFYEKFDDDKGTSSVLINTLKGQRIFQEIVNRKLIRYKHVDASELVHGNYELTHSVRKTPYREVFIEDAKNMETDKLFSKYFPITWKVRFSVLLRSILLKLRLYSEVKYIIYVYRRKKFRNAKNKRYPFQVR